MPSFIRRHADHPVDAIEPWLRWVLGEHRLVARGGEDVFDEVARRPRVEVRPGLIEQQHQRRRAPSAAHSAAK